MLHLPALPGSPKNILSIEEIIDFTLVDFSTLIEGKIDGILIENFHDFPFFPSIVESITIASMSIIVNEIVKRSPVPVGVNILRNACSEALIIASLTNAQFIRCNVWISSYVTDQGIIHGCSHKVKRLQRILSATTKGSSPLVFADVHCKHASSLSNRSLDLEVQDAFERGLADAVIITGEKTGVPAKIEDLKLLKEKNFAPILVGSGVTLQNIESFHPFIDGAIVGTSLKKNGEISAPIELKRVKELVAKMDEK